MQRPQGVTKRDLLVGVLAGAAVASGFHPALDIAAKACKPLFDDYAPDMRRWFPIIDSSHARAAIAYAGRTFRLGALTKDEYDWICTKARMAILYHDNEHVLPSSHRPRDFALADYPGKLGEQVRPRLLLRDHSAPGHLPRCDCGHLFEICDHPNCPNGGDDAA